MQTTREPVVQRHQASWPGLVQGILKFRPIAAPAWRSILIGTTLWAIFILFLGLVQFSTPDLADNDGFYHIKLAYMMRTEGLKPAFPYLPITILNAREFYDHHFLYHVALMPFTFGDLRLGAKWASVLFASLAFLAVWRLLDKQRVPYAALWSLGLLAVSEAFIYRMSIPRAQSLSLALLAIGLHWLLTKQHVRLLVLGFVYVWLYNAFPLLLGMAGIYVFSAWMVERRLDLKPLIYAGIGIGLGLVINPYFPYNIIFAYQHILPKLTEATAISVGNEWYPYDTGQLLSNSPLGLAAFLSGTLALGLAGRRMDLRTATGLLLASLFGLMLFQSRRFIEYFPAFALIFAAFAWTPYIEDTVLRLKERGMTRSKLLLGKMRQALPGLALGLILFPGIWLTFEASEASIQRSKPYQLYEGASAWLAANTPQGERVFQTDWDDFPRLFFYNTHNTYLVGLDPTYLQLYDARLYEVWEQITRGDMEQPSDSILADFGARYVLTDLNHKSFLRQAGDDPNLVEVYRDDDAVVFQVVDGIKN